MIALYLTAVYLVGWIVATAIFTRYYDTHPKWGDDDRLPPAFPGAAWPLWVFLGIIMAVGWAVQWLASKIAGVLWTH